MLSIEENIQAINFCEYFIGQDKTEVKFLLESFVVFEGNPKLLLNYNTESRVLPESEEILFTIVNVNQPAIFSIYTSDTFEYQKKINVLDILRYLDTKQIVANDWIVYYTKDKSQILEYIVRVSIYLSEFNKKQLLDIKLKTLLAIHNKIEQIEIEKHDIPSKNKNKNKKTPKKTANLIYTISAQDPCITIPIKSPESETKPKEPGSTKTVPSYSNKISEKPAPEFEFKAKIDCIIA
jgi:hypothetical protein